MNDIIFKKRERKNERERKREREKKERKKKRKKREKKKRKKRGGRKNLVLHVTIIEVTLILLHCYAFKVDLMDPIFHCQL
jgi:hypothetical protein